MIISRVDLHQHFNRRILGEKSYWEIPTLLCPDCFELVQMMVTHNPPEIEIYPCGCKKSK